MKTKEIKLKIRSVNSIKKITKTMEMISISKMRRSVERALASRTYSHYALELLVNLSKDRRVENKLMLAPAEADKELLIVLGGNKGLCGGYHTNLYKALNLYLSLGGLTAKSEIKAITVGKYAEKICQKLGLENFASFNNFSEYSTIEQTKELSHLVVKEFIKGKYRSVKILYTEFLKSTAYKPVLREIFPVNINTLENILEEANSEEALSGRESLGGLAAKSGFYFTDYKFEPDIDSILENVLPGLVYVVIHQTLAEAFASEHSARMFAMKNASDNASVILDDLTLAYNHARQHGITRELSEIVAGEEALNG